MSVSEHILLPGFERINLFPFLPPSKRALANSFSDSVIVPAEQHVAEVVS